MVLARCGRSTLSRMLPAPRPHRRLPRPGARIARAVLAALVSVGIAASSVVAEPASASTCAQSRGSLEDVILASRIAGRVPVRVYLPPCYATIGRAFPLLILLHGSPGSYTDWTTELGVNAALDAGIRNGSMPSMIVAMPDGGARETQQPYAVSGTFEAEIMTELLPALERRFCISRRPADHAIGGFSRGGWWALEIAFRHPTAFAAVGGHSAFLYAGAAAPRFDPYVLARSVPLPPGGSLRLWLDAGLDDYARPGLGPLLATLAARHVSFAYHVWPGEHEAAYWRAHVAAYLGFYGRRWPRDTAQLLACAII
jgi:enterochelin esterase-like enzyme